MPIAARNASAVCATSSGPWVAERNPPIRPFVSTPCTSSARRSLLAIALGWFFSSSRVSLRVEPTTYLIQVGARDPGGLVGEGVISAWVTFRPDRDLDRDGWLRPQDCDDGNAGVHPGAPDRPGDGADQDCDARDADDDGYAVPSDCDDRSPGVNPGAVDVPDDGVDQDCDRADAVDTDRDDDGFSRPQDCRDDRRDVNPGAVDVPGDRVDQDCAEGDAPYPALLSGVSGYFRRAGRSLAFVELAVSSVPRRTSVVLRCRGRGCPFERRTRSVERAASRVDLTRTVRSVRLRRGTVFELTLLKRGHVGRVVRWSVRSLRRAPRRTNLCRPPGTRRPGSCEEPARGAAARAP